MSINPQIRTLVMKFGGSTVGTTTALTQLASIVLHERERWDQLLIVVSALDGVTDQLIEAAHLAKLDNRRGYRRIVANLRIRHLALVEHLLGQNERTALLSNIDSLLYDMLDVCQSLSATESDAPQDSVDAIIGVGERLAARIVAALLRQNGLRSVAIDTTDLIITDTVYGNATPNIPLTRERIQTQLSPLLSRQIMPVLTGFIGATPTGKPTTLGRGGSDYTASILSICADASEVWIWTDVDGMMSADPNEIEDAHPIASMSYDAAAEMAYFGARILHTRMIGLLRERQVLLRIRNIYMPQQPGTLIQAIAPQKSVGLQAVTSIAAIALSTSVSGTLVALTALVDEIFFEETGNHADVMIADQSSRHSFACYVVPTTAGQDAVHTLLIALQDRLADTDWDAHIVTVVTAVGTSTEKSHELSARILLGLDGIPILATAYSPARYSISLVIETVDAENALRQIHKLIA